ncbi:MAG TPA: hypothetical protein VI488_16830 [Candidatus Angelobacter sp.]
MDLIDRYLQAIQFALPKGQPADILRELSEDLHSQIEEKENRLGRKLNEDEIATILKQRGHPIRVAGGYLPRQHLIGPALFPFYRAALKMAALFFLLPWVVVLLCFLIFDREYPAEPMGFNLFRDWAVFLQVTMFGFALITIVFAAFERTQAKLKFLDRWDPRKLPAVVQHRAPSFRSRTLTELFFNVSFIVWWLTIGQYPRTFFGFAAGLFMPAAALGAYYWPILGLALVNLMQQITNAVRPQWTWLRPATLLVTNTIFAVMLSFILKIEPLVVLKEPYSHEARYAEAAPIVNTAVFCILAGVGIGVVIACAVYGYQIVQLLLRRRQGRSGMPAPVQTL